MSVKIRSGIFLLHARMTLPVAAEIAIFMNEVKGKSMLALSRDLGTTAMASRSL
jgi:hypothetical protein